MCLPGGGNPYGIRRWGQDDKEQTGEGEEASKPVVELMNPDMYKYGGGGSNDPFSGIWSRSLRVKITGRDGFEKLDIRIPVCHFF